MKKFFKISIINIVLILILLIIAEISAFLIEINVLLKEGCFQEEKNIIKILRILQHYHNIVSGWNNEPYYINSIRKPEINPDSKQNLFILGCSFAYGHELENNQTLHYKLAKQSKRNVYNLAMSSTGPREVLHILRNKKFLNENNLDGGYKSEYFIYVIIGDHYRRLIYDLNEHAPHYKKMIDNKLVLLENKIFYCSYLYRQLKLLQYRLTPEEKIKNLFNIYLQEINEEIKQNYKTSNNEQSELIIIDWGVNIVLPKHLQEEKIRIIPIEELTKIDINNIEYQISKKDTHPNEKAWEVIVPALVKELNL